LLKEALEELALQGYFAWPNRTGAAHIDGRFIPFGKKGSGDILIVLPPHGRHCEAEGKTGDAVQSKAQKVHQRMVEKNGGLYLIFRSKEDLLSQLRAAGY